MTRVTDSFLDVCPARLPVGGGDVDPRTWHRRRMRSTEGENSPRSPGPGDYVFAGYPGLGFAWFAILGDVEVLGRRYGWQVLFTSHFPQINFGPSGQAVHFDVGWLILKWVLH